VARLCCWALMSLEESESRSSTPQPRSLQLKSASTIHVQSTLLAPATCTFSMLRCSSTCQLAAACLVLSPTTLCASSIAWVVAFMHVAALVLGTPRPAAVPAPCSTMCSCGPSSFKMLAGSLCHLLFPQGRGQQSALTPCTAHVCQRLGD
jgi:hypothetical protein